ncbi:MAG: trypsin-like peptidase domain-containing protein [Clostridium sp.]
MTSGDRDEKKVESTMWESGVKYIEPQKSIKLPNKLKFLIVGLIVALIGGAIGSYIVYREYKIEIDNKIQKFEEKQSESILNGNISKIAQKVGPSIVGISKTHKSWIDEATGGSLGSGIIFDTRGYIVTNQHIINDIDNITVTLSGGKRVPATIVGEDHKSDIAVLKINVENLTAVKFGDSDKIKTGASVIGMGNPLGEEFSGSLTLGVISGTNKVIKVDDRVMRLYQTDMSLTLGNSGGAVIDEYGNVIGIINNKLMALEGGSYIMPINTAKPIINTLMNYGKVEKPFLGVRTFLIDEERSKQYNVPVGLGVVEVVEGTTAEKFKIQKGDIIMEVNNGRVTKITDITDLLEGKKPGDKISVKVYRGGKEVIINTVLVQK